MSSVSRAPSRSNYQLVSTLWISTRACFFRLWHWVCVVWRYYRKPAFACTDLCLLSHYLFCNPHRIGRKYGTLYGETPLTTLDKIAKECRLLSQDVVYELGCGTARTCFWLHHFVKCQVVGIDQVPLFIRRAQQVQRMLHLPLTFLQADVTQCSFERATAIYLYGTGWDETTLRLLSARFPEGVRVITVSFALSDYDKRFSTLKQFEGHFPWGKARIFLNCKGACSHRETSVACREGI